MKTKLINAVKSSWLILVAIFVVRHFWLHYAETALIIQELPFETIAMAVLATLCGKILLYLLSYISLRYVDKSLSYRTVFDIYNLTQLIKYVPGTVWQFIGKAGSYKNKGVPNDAVKWSILIEVFFVLGSAVFVGGILLLASKTQLLAIVLSKLGNYVYFYTCLMLAGVIIFGIYRQQILKIVRTISGQRSLNGAMLLVSSGVWLSLGLSLYVMILPYASVNSFGSYLETTGLFAISFAIGFVVPFAPAGIGIRETILVAGLAPLLPVNTAITIATLNRALYMFIEVCIACGILLLRRKPVFILTKEQQI